MLIRHQVEADATITATIRALIAARNVTQAQVSIGIGVPKRTLARRLVEGGWLASEVAGLAEMFGCNVAGIYAGRINVTPPRGPHRPDGLPQQDSNLQPAGYTGLSVLHSAA